jgi:hypothetical protein
MSTDDARGKIEEERLAAVEHLAALVHDPSVADRRRDQAATTLLSLSLGTVARREPSTAPARANGSDMAVALSDDEAATLRSKGWSDDEVATLRKGRATPRGGQLHAIAKGLMGWLQPELAAIKARLAELERKKGIAPLAARVGELEQRPGLKYQGVWAAEKVYSVGDFVTDHGSLWHCWDGNVGVRPGPGCEGTWQLAVQRGRDAKDKGNR